MSTNAKTQLHPVVTREDVDDLKKVVEENFGKFIDIHSRMCKFPFCRLSNFTVTNFTFDGVQIVSMEGFLQSLKTSDQEEQLKICGLKGKAAKLYGKKLAEKGVFDGKTMHWKGEEFSRFSDRYQEILKATFQAKYDADEQFRIILELSKGRRLVHTRGKMSPYETILTIPEYISILTSLRETGSSMSK